MNIDVTLKSIIIFQSYVDIRNSDCRPENLSLSLRKRWTGGDTSIEGLEIK